jgi:hypothetical protein
MLLSGDLMGADQMKKINVHTEKVELQQRQREMTDHFELARAQLKKRQELDTEKLRMDQEYQQKHLADREKFDLVVKTRRVEATQRIFTEEKDYARFITKKFRKSAEIVVPTTVVAYRDVKGDLPAIARGKIAPPGVAQMLELRTRIEVTRLPLAPLAVKHYRPPPLVKPVKTRRSESVL